MGFNIEFINGKRYYTGEKIKIRIQAWQPDIDYSQMHMMIDKLISEGVSIIMDHVAEQGEWFINIGDRNDHSNISFHKNIRTAFRLACTEFKTAK